ncbi:hypothetical protein CRUP_030701 [Coryphaenoides rupestris]|nr:hypothetical protein CRUP_030701 [Coryphaenoides rupestris]
MAEQQQGAVLRRACHGVAEVARGGVGVAERQHLGCDDAHGALWQPEGGVAGQGGGDAVTAANAQHQAPAQRRVAVGVGVGGAAVVVGVADALRRHVQLGEGEQGHPGVLRGVEQPVARPLRHVEHHLPRPAGPVLRQEHGDVEGLRGGLVLEVAEVEAEIVVTFDPGRGGVGVPQALAQAWSGIQDVEDRDWGEVWEVEVEVAEGLSSRRPPSDLLGHMILGHNRTQELNLRTAGSALFPLRTNRTASCPDVSHTRCPWAGGLVMVYSSCWLGESGSEAWSSREVRRMPSLPSPRRSTVLGLRSVVRLGALRSTRSTCRHTGQLALLQEASVGSIGRQEVERVCEGGTSCPVLIGQRPVFHVLLGEATWRGGVSLQGGGVSL